MISTVQVNVDWLDGDQEVALINAIEQLIQLQKLRSYSGISTITRSGVARVGRYLADKYSEEVILEGDS